MHDLYLKHAIQQSVRLSGTLQEMLGTEAILDRRGRLAMAYLSLSLDHREAILLLVDCGAFASATALQRPLLEAFVTGAWIDSSASDEELQPIAAFIRPPPKFETMTQRLRKMHDLRKRFEVLRRHYEILGDYAHGHRRQLSRWLSKDSVAPRYSDDQMAEMLRYVDMVGILAAIHREKIAGRPINQLLQMLEVLMHRHQYPGSETEDTCAEIPSAQAVVDRNR